MWKPWTYHSRLETWEHGTTSGVLWTTRTFSYALCGFNFSCRRQEISCDAEEAQSIHCATGRGPYPNSWACRTMVSTLCSVLCKTRQTSSFRWHEVVHFFDQLWLCLFFENCRFTEQNFILGMMSGQSLGIQVTAEPTAVGNHVANGGAERTVELVRSHANILVTHLESSCGMDRQVFGCDHRIYAWAFVHSAWLHNRFRVSQGEAAYERFCGRVYSGRLAQFGERVMRYLHQEKKSDPKWLPAIWLGKTLIWRCVRRALFWLVVLSGGCRMVSIWRCLGKWSHRIGSMVLHHLAISYFRQNDIKALVHCQLWQLLELQMKWVKIRHLVMSNCCKTQVLLSSQWNLHIVHLWKNKMWLVLQRK